jgi:hypothetical protein
VQYLNTLHYYSAAIDDDLAPLTASWVEEVGAVDAEAVSVSNAWYMSSVDGILLHGLYAAS